MDLRKLKDKATEAFGKGRFAKAAELYEQYCSADPKDFQARLRMGDAFAKSGTREKAIVAYKSAAEGFARDGFLPRAIAAAKLVLELDASHRGIQQMLADLYARKSGAPRRVLGDHEGKPAPQAKAREAIELPPEEIPTEDEAAPAAAWSSAKGPSPLTRADAIELAPEPKARVGPSPLATVSVELELELSSAPQPAPEPPKTVRGRTPSEFLSAEPTVVVDLDAGSADAAAPGEIVEEIQVELTPAGATAGWVVDNSSELPAELQIVEVFDPANVVPVRPPAGQALEAAAALVTRPPPQVAPKAEALEAAPGVSRRAPQAEGAGRHAIAAPGFVAARSPEPRASVNPAVSGNSMAPLAEMLPVSKGPSSPPAEAGVARPGGARHGVRLESVPHTSRIWLPTAPSGDVAVEPRPAAREPASAPKFKSDLEAGLAALSEFTELNLDLDQLSGRGVDEAPRAPVVASLAADSKKKRLPSFAELELEGDSLLHAVEAAARAGSVARGQEIVIEVEEEAFVVEESDERALPTIPLFSDLAPEEFVELFERCPLKRFARGELVIQQGALGDAFYVICEGEVRVFRDDETGRHELAAMGEGAFFGEMALLSGAPRTATVEAAADEVQVLEISAPVLAELSMRYPEVAQALKRFCRQRLLSNVMRSSALFRPFSKSDQREVLQRFRARDAARGDVLVVEGKPSDGLYVVLSGEVEVVKGSRRLAMLREGELFGEMSLLEKSFATASVRATKHTSLLRLPRAVFDELILSHPQILAHVSELIDARRKSTGPAAPMI